MKSWNIINILIRKHNYYCLLKNENDSKKITKYKEIITSLDEILQFFSVGAFTNNKDIDYLNKNYLYTFGFCTPFISYFSENIPNIELDNTKFSNIDLSKEEMLLLLRNFYYDLNNYYGNCFDYLVYNTNNRLNYKKNIFSNCNGIGYTFPVYGTRNFYMNIVKQNNMQDILTFAHEFGHAIAFLINPSSDILFEKHLFSEFESIFNELLMQDFLRRNLINDKTYINMGLDKINTYHSIADKCNIKTKLYENYGYNLNNTAVTKLLIKEFNINNEDTKSITSLLFQEELPYVYSFLLAVELYYIYIQDKKEALNILKKITLLSGLDAIGYNKKVKEYGLRPCNNIYNYYKKFGGE